MADHTSLDVRVVGDALLVPRDLGEPRTSPTGVLQRVDGTVVPVPGTGLRRRGRELFEGPAPADLRPTRRIERAIFGGYLFNHYGHFVLESLARLWPGGRGPDVPIVWLARTAGAIRPWMSTIAARIGLEGQLLVVDAPDGPLEVGELIVADPGFEIRGFADPAYTSRLAWYPAQPSRRGSKLWLSRQGLGDWSGLAEEAELEAELARQGWRSVRLEEHSIKKQARILAGASHIAGIEGSAFHTLLFVRDFRGTIDMLDRHGNPNYDLLAEASGWDQVRYRPVGGEDQGVIRRSGRREIRWTGTDVRATAALINRSAGRLVTR